VPDEPEARLVVLGPESTYRQNDPESIAAKGWLDESVRLRIVRVGTIDEPIGQLVSLQLPHGILSPAAQLPRQSDRRQVLRWGWAHRHATHLGLDASVLGDGNVYVALRA